MYNQILSLSIYHPDNNNYIYVMIARACPKKVLKNNNRKRFRKNKSTKNYIINDMQVRFPE